VRRTHCLCAFCEHRRLFERLPDPPEDELRLAASGVFGNRPCGTRSRLLEHVEPDYFNGRRAGGHAAPTFPPLPKPDFLEQRQTERLLQEIRKLVALARIPAARLGTPVEYRAELEAQACDEFFAARSKGVGEAASQAVARARDHLSRLYRELA
jgi:hypothetical protein